MNLPNRLIFLCVLFAVVARVAAGTPGTQRLDFEPDFPAVINVTPVAERWNGEGFMPVRVQIENRSREPLAWDFSFGVNFGGLGSVLTHELRLGVEPGSVFETVVFVPGAGAVSSDRRAYVSVSLAGPGARGYGSTLLHGGNDEVVNTATTASLEEPLFSAVNGAPGVKSEISVVDPALWPADWRVWSPFARVVLDEREYAGLDGARRAALRDWAAMGGALDIYPTDGFGAPAVSLKLHGHGTIRPMLRSLAAEAATSGKREIRIGKSDVDDLADFTASFISPTRREEMTLSRGALGVSLFLVAFAVLVGPVNLFVFAPSRRRHRLFFTTPLISLGASLVLAGYIVVKDGFGGEGARHGLVWLLPESNQAVVSQGQISRTGVLLGGGFEVPDDVLLARTDERADHLHFDHRQRTDSYSRAGGRAGGDWFTSRRMQQHTLRRLVPTRARVELVGGGVGDEPPIVQSSVGTVLRDFVYLDAGGIRWVADEVGPGERVTLRRSTDPLVASIPRGCFSARGGAAEGLAPIPTLASIRWDESEFLYAGPVVGARTP
jgi:hypothetical protein